MDEVLTIVVDNGTCRMRAGIAGDEAPRTVFRSLIGHPRLDAISIKFDNKDVYIGDEATMYSCISSLKYPIERGVVVNWDDMEKIYDHTFKELHVDPQEHPILLSEALSNPKANREKMIQIMFETFNVPSFYVDIQSYLSIFAAGRTTGLVCDVGDGVTQISPIYEGYPISNAAKRINFAGQDIINHFQRILNYRGYNFTTSEEKEIIRDIFEIHGLVNCEDDIQKCKGSPEFDVVYTLPDGNCITIADERFRCTEILFNPEKEGYEFIGIHKMISESIKECDESLHKDFYANIIATGGVSLVKGFSQRLENEVCTTSVSSEVRVVDLESAPTDTVFVGGSILASLPLFPQIVITHDEYNDSGPGLVHQQRLYI